MNAALLKLVEGEQERAPGGTDDIHERVDMSARGVIIGGLGSMEGAILASLLLGYSETLVSILISANYSDMVYLIAIILVLALRPRGLLARGRAQ